MAVRQECFIILEDFKNDKNAVKSYDFMSFVVCLIFIYWLMSNKRENQKSSTDQTEKVILFSVL